MYGMQANKPISIHYHFYFDIALLACVLPVLLQGIIYIYELICGLDLYK